MCRDELVRDPVVLVLPPYTVEVTITLEDQNAVRR